MLETSSAGSSDTIIVEVQKWIDTETLHSKNLQRFIIFCMKLLLKRQFCAGNLCFYKGYNKDYSKPENLNKGKKWELYWRISLSKKFHKLSGFQHQYSVFHKQFANTKIVPDGYLITDCWIEAKTPWHCVTIDKIWIRDLKLKMKCR